MKLHYFFISAALMSASCSSGDGSGKEQEQNVRDSIEANKAYEAEREAQEYLRDSLQRIESDTLPASA